MLRKGQALWAAWYNRGAVGKQRGQRMAVATEPEFYTVKEVAERLRVSLRSVYRMVEQGKVRAIRIGDTYRISAESLNNFIRSELEGGER
jgi:excisionase family DNA binding protein